MKQVIIGDIHGHDSWKKIVEAHPDADRVIFIGDYVDSFSVLPIDQAKNLDEIVGLKIKEPNKYILLVGNHDFQYMDNGLMNERYSGFQSRMYETFRYIFDTNKDLFQMCFEDEYGTVYTHAGLTKTFVDKVIGSYSMEQVNDVFKYKPGRFGISQFDRSGCGESIESSCIWVRPQSLYNDSISKFQVVGHTIVAGIHLPNTVGLDKIGQPGYFILIDALPKQYLSCTNGIFKIENL